MEEYTFAQFVKDNAILSGVFVALIAILIYTEFQMRTRKFSDVKPVDAVKLMNHKNAVVLDIRSEKEYKDGHIINAIHVPPEKIDTEIKKLGKNKDKPVITYCRSGNTSQQACKALEKQGFTSIHNLRGGLAAWERDGLPLNK
jgi:rhodanese-related sulfurtransferase